MAILRRRLFLVSAVLALPTLAYNKLTAAGKGIKVAAGHDRFNGEITFGGGSPHHLKVSGKDNGGALCIFEGVATRKGGPRLHVHREQDETFYVLDGRFRVQVGDVTFDLSAGDCVFAPRAVPHTFAHIGDGSGKMMVVFQPAGRMEAYFEELGKIKSAPTDDALKKMFSDHGMDVVGPPLTVA